VCLTPASEALSGSPEAIASQLKRFAEVGITHLIVALEPKSLAGIERFAHIVALLPQQ